MAGKIRRNMNNIISDEVIKLREEYQKLDQEEDRIIQLKKEKLKELQDTCNHLFIAEAPYISGDYIISTPPRRICEICGIEENGWGCGHKILITQRPRNISRDELYEMQKLKHSLESIEK
jgi:hypothetical protein